MALSIPIEHESLVNALHSHFVWLLVPIVMIPFLRETMDAVWQRTGHIASCHTGDMASRSRVTRRTRLALCSALKYVANMNPTKRQSYNALVWFHNNIRVVPKHWRICDFF